MPVLGSLALTIAEIRPERRGNTEVGCVSGICTDKRACVDWSRKNLGAIRVQYEFPRVP
jgi:hypothetical protein